MDTDIKTDLLVISQLTLMVQILREFGNYSYKGVEPNWATLWNCAHSVGTGVTALKYPLVSHG